MNTGAKLRPAGPSGDLIYGACSTKICNPRRSHSAQIVDISICVDGCRVYFEDAAWQSMIS